MKPALLIDFNRYILAIRGSYVQTELDNDSKIRGNRFQERDTLVGDRGYSEASCLLQAVAEGGQQQIATRRPTLVRKNR